MKTTNKHMNICNPIIQWSSNGYNTLDSGIRAFSFMS